MRKIVFISIVFLLLVSSDIFAQRGYYGARLGLSLARADETTPKLGLQAGGLLEYVTASNFSFGTEVNLNTQKGMPIELALQAKYYFETSVKGLLPYLGIGGDMWFFGEGPYFGAKVIGGMDMQLGRHFAIPLDFQWGQVFIGDETAYYFGGSTGIKFAF